jgi:TRAP-type mannitol/chloroaromatic compound transport system permease large subunit
MLYWLFFGSSALIGVYTLAGGTRLIQDWMTGLPFGATGVLLMIMLIWIVLGCFIDWIGILLLTAPIFVPVAEKLGFDPVWLGILFCMNMQISYISPRSAGRSRQRPESLAIFSARSGPHRLRCCARLVIALPDRTVAGHDDE